MSINDRDLGKFNVDGKNTAKYNVRTADYSSATGTSVSVNCYLVDGPGVFYGANVIFNSAAIGSAIDKLEEAMVNHVTHGHAINTGGILISNMRHVQSLKACVKAVRKAIDLLAKDMSLEFISEEIKIAISSLDTITGRDLDADLIDQIFSSICIGK